MNNRQAPLSRGWVRRRKDVLVLQAFSCALGEFVKLNHGPGGVELTVSYCHSITVYLMLNLLLMD
jgi:hypothetical protein